MNVYSSDIREALEEPLAAVVDAIKATLEGTSPELCSDIYDNGIVLTGGGAQLCGLDTLISEKTHLPVYISKAPLDCVAEGILRVMENKEKDLLEEQLQKEEIPVGDIYFATGESLDLVTFSVKQSADRQPGQEAGDLYKAARAFIGYIQQMGIKKGNMEYEN